MHCVCWNCTRFIGFPTCLCASKGVCGLLTICTDSVDTAMGWMEGTFPDGENSFPNDSRPMRTFVTDYELNKAQGRPVEVKTEAG